MSFDKIDTPEADRKIQEIPIPTKKINIGNTPMWKGLTMWEINLKTLECLPAVFKTSTIQREVDLGDVKSDMIHYQLIVRDGYFYAKTINEKNALRKLKQKTGIG